MTTLRLTNTLTRTKEDFVPLDASNVRMYVCGPTVYDYAHIGNARPAIVFDVLFRLLRHLYGADHVTYVRNITDIDDKINARALEMGGDPLQAIRTLTDRTAKIYEEDMAALGNLEPTHTPRATHHISEMITMIEALIAAGHAYASDGHVLFDVSSKPDYGKLARRSPDDMIAGSRVEIAPYKKNPMDFVLWKPSDAQTPGWVSPWGFGRPGWHLECSAMAERYFGETFDIHGGGIDLVFPHHENEIAQSEGAHHGHPFARYWLHNGHLNVEGAKMSKSLGNFVTVRELLRTKSFGDRSWTGSTLRLAMLKTHYRQPIDWTADSLRESEEELANWTNALSNFQFSDELVGNRRIGMALVPPSAFLEALADDLNTAQTLTVMREMFSRFTRGDRESGLDLARAAEFLGVLNFERLGVFNPYYVGSGPKLLPPRLKPAMREIQVAYANSNLEGVDLLRTEMALEGVRVEVRGDGKLAYEVSDAVAAIDEAYILTAIEARLAARKAKNFAGGDRIRDELLAKGIVLKDNKDGTTSWEVKR